MSTFLFVSYSTLCLTWVEIRKPNPTSSLIFDTGNSIHTQAETGTESGFCCWENQVKKGNKVVNFRETILHLMLKYSHNNKIEWKHRSSKKNCSFSASSCRRKKFYWLRPMSNLGTDFVDAEDFLLVVLMKCVFCCFSNSFFPIIT